jgi:hypothetical protein
MLNNISSILQPILPPVEYLIIAGAGGGGSRSGAGGGGAGGLLNSSIAFNLELDGEPSFTIFLAGLITFS